MSGFAELSRRERQIMDIVYELGEVSASQVKDKMPNPPSYSAVRAMLSKLETKGLIAHKEAGAKYIYYPLIEHEQASQGAISRLVKTFFEGSASQAVNALLGMSLDDISQDELKALEKIIKQARQKEKNQEAK